MHTAAACVPPPVRSSTVIYKRKISADTRSCVVNDRAAVNGILRPTAMGFIISEAFSEAYILSTDEVTRMTCSLPCIPHVMVFFLHGCRRMHDRDLRQKTVK